MAWRDARATAEAAGKIYLGGGVDVTVAKHAVYAARPLGHAALQFDALDAVLQRHPRAARPGKQRQHGAAVAVRQERVALYKGEVGWCGHRLCHKDSCRNI
jgi:hypothetical protein